MGNNPFFPKGDDLTRLNLEEAKRAKMRREPLPPPDGKPGHLLSNSEVRAVELRAERWRKMAEEDARLDELLRTEPEGDRKLIALSVQRIRDIGAEAVVTVGDDSVTVTPPEPKQPQADKERLQQAVKAAPRPPGVEPNLWEAVALGLLASIEMGVEVGTSGVKWYFRLKAKELAAEIRRYRDARRALETKASGQLQG